MSSNNNFFKTIDNNLGRELKDVIKDRLKKCNEAKFAVGYFFLSGFNLVVEDFSKDYSSHIVTEKRITEHKHFHHMGF